MDWIIQNASTIGVFLVVITILVFVHELGHFAVARWCGVRVETFSIGFGKELFGWTSKSGTRWKISALPLGGYVKMFGDLDAASRPDQAQSKVMTEEEKQVAFPFKSLPRRAAIVAAGPLANFIFAILLFAGLFVINGQVVTPPVASQIEPQSVAQAAGLLPGDRIVAVNGENIARFEELQRLVQFNLDSEMELSVQRGDELLTVFVRPAVIEEETGFCTKVRMGRLGIYATGREVLDHDLGSALGASVAETVGIVRISLDSIGQMITGRRSTQELSGPLGIAEMSGVAARAGFQSIIWFMAFISVGLGLINLFPVPMLDGGHLLFYAIEAIRGRPLGPKAQEVGFKIGIALVLSLFVLVTWNDLGRWFWCDS